MISVKKMVLVPYKEQENVISDSGLSNDIIIHSIPKSFQNKARAILDYIKGAVSWNEKGEVMFNGHTYPGTHIADLVRYSIREYGKSPPKDYQEFQRILQELNIPKGLIQHQRTFLPQRKATPQEVQKGWVKL